MTSELERLGAELAVTLRTEKMAFDAYEQAKQKADALITQIQSDQNVGALYGRTREHPLQAVQRAMRDHTDTGNTYRLTPLADGMSLNTGTIRVPCPNSEARAVDDEAPCRETAPHIHTADGAVHPTTMQPVETPAG